MTFWANEEKTQGFLFICTADYESLQHNEKKATWLLKSLGISGRNKHFLFNLIKKNTAEIKTCGKKSLQPLLPLIHSLHITGIQVQVKGRKRERTIGCFFTLVPKVLKERFLIRWLNNFWDFKCVQKFQPQILIFRWGNFVCHH